MFNLHRRASKFNEDKGWFLYQKTILIVNMRRRLQGKNKRNMKKKNAKKIAEKRSCLRYCFYFLEVAFLKFTK